MSCGIIIISHFRDRAEALRKYLLIVFPANELPTKVANLGQSLPEPSLLMLSPVSLPPPTRANQKAQDKALLTTAATLTLKMIQREIKESRFKRYDYLGSH